MFLSFTSGHVKKQNISFECKNVIFEWNVKIVLIVCIVEIQYVYMFHGYTSTLSILEINIPLSDAMQ